MCERFEAERAPIARVYHCPYHPVHGIGTYRCDHPWRKPNPGMILQAVSDLGLDPARCTILGDKMSDIAAGAAAGICLLGFCSHRTAAGAGTARHRMKRSPISVWRCCGRGLRRLRRIGVSGVLEAAAISTVELAVR